MIVFLEDLDANGLWDTVNARASGCTIQTRLRWLGALTDAELPSGTSQISFLMTGNLQLLARVASSR